MEETPKEQIQQTQLDQPDIMIPSELLPSDGRFGSGPSKIRAAQIASLAAAGTTLLGTSHRQTAVRHIVAEIQDGLRQLFHVPQGYEVVLGNGGATAFWDILCASVIISKAAVGSYGSFSNKLAQSIAAAPFLDDPIVFEAPYGELALPSATGEAADADVFAWAHNETSTGVMAPVQRVSVATDTTDKSHAAAESTTPNEYDDALAPLTVIDATSGAGGLPVDISQTDIYYFSPQKVFGSDGGLWVAICSPRAIARAAYVEGLTQTQHTAARWIPPFLSLSKAVANSRKNQTLNTPAIATLIMMRDQIQWMIAQGGLEWATQRTAQSSAIVYEWAQEHPLLTPFVHDPSIRSQVVATVDVDESIEVHNVLSALRRYGIVDVAGYRALGRNQLRIGVFPSVEPEDVQKLTQCINVVLEQLHTTSLVTFGR